MTLKPPKALNQMLDPTTPPLNLGTLPENPKISIITVSYNHGQYLKRNIESVLAQGYDNIEHIIVDGGSKDNTTQVLESYDHLIWTSEPDRGQSHALNKGFRKATGDIIAWLNSDDSYPEGVFTEIIPLLKQHPVLMGACQVVDENGTPGIRVPNNERCWFDFLKYWISHSSPSQPSLFFRREVLHLARRTDGNFIDENLHYAMDLDLWLRVAQHVPFTQRSEKTLSIYPIYDECKTGGDWEPIFAEMKEVCTKYERETFPTHSSFTFAIEIGTTTTFTTLSSTLEALSQQNMQDFEVLLVGGAKSKEFLQQALSSFPSLLLSHTELTHQTPYLSAAHAAASPFLTFFAPGVTLTPNFAEACIEDFEENHFGALCSLGHGASGEATPEVFFGAHRIFPCVTIRRTALLENQELFKFQNLEFFIKELGLVLLAKGWRIKNMSAEASLPSWNIEEAVNYYVSLKNYVNAHIALLLKQIQDEDPFHPVRVEGGHSFVLPENIFPSAAKLLNQAPENWEQLGQTQELSSLEKCRETTPQFSPTLALLVEKYSEQGLTDEAQTTMELFATSYERELNL